ncbi:MAG: putative Ig domain-containing protein [Myxococcaceae bacterium]|nr:putative Ig domain-containing protein [Myxococcaceae bacterium]MCI0673445.1 putative Ig domain-containing protein [Myxococcaceae bacterium]
MRPVSFRATLLLLLAAVLGAGCGGGERPPSNRLPALGGVSALPESVSSGSTVSLEATASDADGDELTYTWTQEPASPAGSFSDPAARAPTWTAPTVSASQRFTLEVAVSDGHGGSATGRTTVDVSPPAPGNRAPTLSAGPSAAPSPAQEQQSVALSVTATDPDGDALTYAWTQLDPATPTGSFSSTSVANPTWTAPDVSANTSFTLRVSITDGKGDSVQGTLSLVGGGGARSDGHRHAAPPPAPGRAGGVAGA